MKSLISRYSIAVFIISFLMSAVSEARIGGGRTTGSRGYRSFGTRSFSAPPSSPYRSYQQPYSAPPQQQPAQPNYSGSVPRSGGFLKNFAGGLAGGFLGSMLFRSLGHAGLPMGSGGGIGILEIFLLAALGYMVFRLLSNRNTATAGGYREMSHYEKLRSVEPGPFAPAQRNPDLNHEESVSESLRRYDPHFDLSRFKEDRMDDFVKLQSAWNQRNLGSVSHLIEPELRNQFEADIQDLKQSRKINKIENIAVRNSELVEAWQEFGREFVTIRFRANLTDYTIDENTGAIVAGDASNPIKFEEDWTFVRRTQDARSADSWKLSAIEV